MVGCWGTRSHLGGLGVSPNVEHIPSASTQLYFLFTSRPHSSPNLVLLNRASLADSFFVATERVTLMSPCPVS